MNEQDGLSNLSSTLFSPSDMENCEPLLLYGALVLAITGSLIVVPYLRGKAPLLSGWNVMLLGVAIYSGLGSIEAATSPMRFHGLQWFNPTKDEVSWFLAATSIFIVTLIATYYWNPLSSVTARTLNKWPRQNTAMYLCVIIASLIIVVLVPLTAHIVFVGGVVLNLSHKAIIFAVVFGFMLWLRSRLNLAWLALFVGAFLAAALLAMLFGAGRRMLLSVFLAPVVCIYMTHVRLWRPTRGMVIIGAATLGVLIVGIMYNAIRRGHTMKERTVASVIEGVRSVGERDWWGRFASDRIGQFTQTNTHYAMLTKRFVETGELEAKPLNTLAFLISYPVPRRVWADKPSIVGITLVHEVVGWRTTNWGVNVAGHAAYEGGLWVAALYGFLAAVGLRFLDDPLQRQPTNPFLIAILASAAPHILGWTRGDLGVMSKQTAECFLLAVLLAIGCRILFGTERKPTSVLTPSHTGFMLRPVR